ncbi:MAG: YbjQ family protein [Sediminispirochaetaceae bacterium]
MEEIIIAVCLVLLGYFSGRIAEKRHYQHIFDKEESLRHIAAHNLKKPLKKNLKVERCELAIGQIVVSQDYFKRFLAIIRSITGGTMGSYETLVDRGRRDAIIRMKESCPGADEFVNMRIETSVIGNNGTGNNGLGSIEVLAYSTALFYQTAPLTASSE